MQREIKFRGQREDTKEWVYGNLIINQRDNETYIGVYEPKTDGITLEWNIYKIISETIGQYTGLKDKNDKKLYEGYIIREIAECDESGKNLYYFYKIVWDKENFSFAAKEIYTNNYTYLDELGDIEIIGNIYDNPELLQETSHGRNN